MVDKYMQIESVAQKGRLPVDISDMRDEIESCRGDAAWKELPLAAKIRVLIRERLDQLREEEKSTTAAKSGN